MQSAQVFGMCSEPPKESGVEEVDGQGVGLAHVAPSPQNLLENLWEGLGSARGLKVEMLSGIVS